MTPLRRTMLPAIVMAAIALTSAMAFPHVASAQHPIAWTLSDVPAKVDAGAPFTVKLSARIPPGWHIYSTTQPPGGPLPTVVTVKGDTTFAVSGPLQFPAPDVAMDSAFNIYTETYVDSVTIATPLTAHAGGKRTLTLDVHYQACTQVECLPPISDRLSQRVQVEGAVAPAAAAPGVAPPAPPTGAATAPPTTGRATTAATGGPVGTGATTGSLALFLWLAAVMGALSLLTPCVFPMIPITVSYFTRAHEAERGSAARRASIYGIGIMATFTIFGMAIAVLVGAGGINRFAANPWINLLVTAIFVAFAFNLFGAYEITIPARWLTALDRATGRAGGSETVGILLMGFTFTLTSFTCTAPFVGTLLVMAAQGHWEWPLLGLLVFSAVFAFPFFLLALAPRIVTRLPRSGEWLHRVKVVMGLLEIATAMKFLANADLVWQWGIFTRPVVLVVWGVTALVMAGYLLGVVRWIRGTGRPTALGVIGAAAALAVACYVGLGLAGRRLGELESFLPPPEGGVTHGTLTEPGGLTWLVNDYAGALSRARAEHKAVLVDFTGYTCTNCRWMESNMFPRPEVHDRLARMVRVRLYTDGDGDVYQQQQQLELQKFGTVALPYYALLDSTGRVEARFVGMTRNTREFTDFLDHGTE